MSASNIFILLNLWYLIGLFSMNNNEKHQKNISTIPIKISSNYHLEKNESNLTKHTNRKSYHQPETTTTIKRRFQNDNKYVQQPKLLSPDPSQQLIINQNFHESFPKQQNQNKTNQFITKEEEEFLLKTTQEFSNPKTNEGIQNKKFYFNENEDFNKSILSTTLRYMNNFVHDGTERFSHLNSKLSTYRQFQHSEEEKINEDNDISVSPEKFYSQEDFSYSNDSIKNILNYENQQIVHSENEIYFPDLEYGIGIRSDISDHTTKIDSETSSQFNAEIISDEENVLNQNNNDIQSPNSFSQMVTQNAENYKLLSGNSRKGIRILPIVNFTATAMAHEDVCVICLGDFDEFCPKFKVELQNQTSNDEGIIHKAHNSLWHKECILQWIEINEKKNNGILCPLCQEELKDVHPVVNHLVPVAKNPAFSRFLSDLYEVKGVVIAATFILILIIILLILGNT